MKLIICNLTIKSLKGLKMYGLNIVWYGRLITQGEDVIFQEQRANGFQAIYIGSCYYYFEFNNLFASLRISIGHLPGKFVVLTDECRVWPDMLTGLFSYDMKHKIYLRLRKTKLMRRWTFNIMAVMHFHLLSSTARVSRLR